MAKSFPASKRASAVEGRNRELMKFTLESIAKLFTLIDVPGKLKLKFVDPSFMEF